LKIFSKSTRIIISHSFTITKSLKYRVASQEFLLNQMVLHFSMLLTKMSEHLQTVFSRLSFASSWLSWNYYGLFFLLAYYSLERPTSHWIDVRLSIGYSSKNTFFKGAKFWLFEERGDLLVWIDGQECLSNRGEYFIFFISFGQTV
jgi:hypothetical protein